MARVVLFGSCARNDPKKDSDYDLAVYARDMGDRLAVGETLSDAAYEYALRGIFIRAIPFFASELNCGPQSELAEHIARDGVIVP